MKYLKIILLYILITFICNILGGLIGEGVAGLLAGWICCMIYFYFVEGVRWHK